MISLIRNNFFLHLEIHSSAMYNELSRNLVCKFNNTFISCCQVKGLNFNCIYSNEIHSLFWFQAKNIIFCIFTAIYPNELCQYGQKPLNCILHRIQPFFSLNSIQYSTCSYHSKHVIIFLFDCKYHIRGS